MFGGIGYDYASLSPAIDSVIAIKQHDSTIRKLGEKNAIISIPIILALELKFIIRLF